MALVAVAPSRAPTGRQPPRRAPTSPSRQRESTQPRRYPERSKSHREHHGVEHEEIGVFGGLVRRHRGGVGLVVRRGRGGRAASQPIARRVGGASRGSRPASPSAIQSSSAGRNCRARVAPSIFGHLPVSSRIVVHVAHKGDDVDRGQNVPLGGRLQRSEIGRGRLGQASRPALRSRGQPGRHTRPTQLSLHLAIRPRSARRSSWGMTTLVEREATWPFRHRLLPRESTMYAVIKNQPSSMVRPAIDPSRPL